ncbi:septal ring lytic transglycosylase RlpA family protein [Halomonas halmophila]|uniref:Endolytic peptidoglycan transglycosylase RlpA n=1 Tax=Halomonas halmophila TaxID=252 RepID=A0A4Y4F444_9GAMM|nr:septal ring lytic transglycosylase RlpA family protein [Halomonas halmophila]GED21848.1 septal ring lipoprotein RlpA [Halomonas halmophila]
MKSRWSVVCAGLLLAGCASDGGQQPPPAGQASQTAAEDTAGGRYAMSSDAYPQQPPDVSQVPDAVPRPEPLSRAGNSSHYEVWGKTYRVLSDANGYERIGTASWYGKKFHGYATANGEIYDMYKMSAAHRTLPLPTFARVTNLDNGRSVIVRVNDRGPFHSKRVIDLSYAAASRLDIVDEGTGRVKVEAIDPAVWQARHGGGAPDAKPAATSSASSSAAVAEPSQGAQPVYLQVAALSSAGSAQALKARLEGRLSRPVRVAGAEDLYRVQVGPLQHANQVRAMRGRLSRAGFDHTFIVDDAE